VHQHDLRRDVLELADIAALDVLKLHLQHARLPPFALRASPTTVFNTAARM
jgi:hypothetical protein